ncbi:diketogulonate reductase-like aldo/keto reductase [Geomicrobium halophilum]|uniref:Diketogulonate reductase-like aldo/keto reductase n=1 Tax=Geomicrobium halophilum TaxID=549000 RepID=A0A841PPL1_9BACL|nr:aldo/keto reductase [Geomicrobium halophilum]MBB6450767.1 diketogulonate reductase-like aldo/keto reductase [Geomicrobium halophilum]
MIQSIFDETTLYNGVKMPWLGLGVYKTEEGEEVEHAVHTALEAGYRSIDTASFYGNEVGVGKAIGESTIARKDIFVTTKVWNDDQGYENTLAAFEQSLEKLKLDYIDLYLIHWPVSGMYKETWQAMEKLYEEGRVKAIGVCNFQIHHLEDLLEECKIKPMVNQVEYHPRLTQKDLHQFCKEQNIQLEAWRPIMRGESLDHPTLVELSEQYGKTPVQVILRWDLENEVVTIPKSVHKDRIYANADIFDFQLDAKDVGKLEAMNENHRFGPHPDDF